MTAILRGCIFLAVSLLGDESHGTDFAKSHKTATLDIKHFSLLGADKRPDDLTLTTDTMIYSKKHKDKSTERT